MKWCWHRGDDSERKKNATFTSSWVPFRIHTETKKKNNNNWRREGSNRILNTLLGLYHYLWVFGLEWGKAKPEAKLTILAQTELSSKLVLRPMLKMMIINNIRFTKISWRFFWENMKEHCCCISYFQTTKTKILNSKKATTKWFEKKNWKTHQAHTLATIFISYSKLIRGTLLRISV